MKIRFEAFDHFQGKFFLFQLRLSTASSSKIQNRAKILLRNYLHNAKEWQHEMINLFTLSKRHDFNRESA